jgi:hypothetical protein
MGCIQCNVNLGTNSASALGPRKSTENLDRVGRSQDLPDGNWLLASSPATWGLDIIRRKPLKSSRITLLVHTAPERTYRFCVVSSGET